MRELLAFYWFLLQVGFQLAVLLLLTTLHRVKQYRSLLLIIAAGALLALLVVFRPPPTPEPTISLPEPPRYHVITTLEQHSPTQIKDKITTLEKVLTLQPTHVATLINLGLLHESLGETEEATEYWRAAFAIDPLHEFFDHLEEDRYK